jgi:hypothetical protein
MMAKAAVRVTEEGIGLKLLQMRVRHRVIPELVKKMETVVQACSISGDALSALLQLKSFSARLPA